MNLVSEALFLISSLINFVFLFNSFLLPVTRLSMIIMFALALNKSSTI
jgi:hypothetical protein